MKKNRFQSTGRLVAGILLLAFAAVVLAGLAVAGPGQANGASASQYAYGKNRIAICHKGRTIHVALPAWKGHQKHGDTLGACP
jgi:hypothetical protein